MEAAQQTHMNREQHKATRKMAMTKSRFDERRLDQ